MEELISIVVPVYKVEKYINRCIDSILQQSYKNFELILVNDGSPDRCGEICENYSRLDSRIKVIHKENGGISEARNEGISLAKGSYIGFIDSDDWIKENYLERLYDLIKMKEADISICNYIKVPDITNPNENKSYRVIEMSNFEALDALTRKYYIQMVVAWGKLYRIYLFNSIRFPVGKVHEDEFTSHKILYKAKKIIFTTEPLLYYWQRADSFKGAGFSIDNKLHLIEAYQERADFFEKKEMDIFKNRTYKTLFSIFKSVHDKHNYINSKEKKDEFIGRYNKFKPKLRKSKQSFKFRMFYELYFISPSIANLVRSIKIKLNPPR